jgi:hypothetical protein
MDKRDVRDELFEMAMEVGEFEVFPMPAELDGDLDNAFLISTELLIGVPKMFIVRVEEFHYSPEEDQDFGGYLPLTPEAETLRTGLLRCSVPLCVFCAERVRIVTL